MDKFGCLQPLEKMLKLLPNTGKHCVALEKDDDYDLRPTGFRQRAVVRIDELFRASRLRRFADLSIRKEWTDPLPHALFLFDIKYYQI